MPQTLQPNTSETFAIKKEIESQLLNLDIKIKKEVLISDVVGLLSEKRQLQELLNQYNNEN
ncbi:hypothetical protein [Flavobacterium sp.]|uniref:hypothetical protein n=1 Tax=Flavobacterium sp. TaxID=239 RepID=UPI003752C796